MVFNFNKIVNRRGWDSIKWDHVGQDDIPMFIADMDFESAPAVKKRIENRIKHPVYGYTMTSQLLYDSFIEWFQNEYGVTIDCEEMEVINGIVPALAVVSNLQKGSSITVSPNYHYILDAPIRAGNEMIVAPLRNTDEFYELDFEALQNCLRPDTKIFYLCNPQNPVGRVYTREELQKVSEFAKKNHLLVISDEIHCELVYDRKHTPFFTVDEYARNNSITFMAPSKTCNIPGVSLAIAIIPSLELREKFRGEGYAMGHPGIFNIEAGIAAYKESREWKIELLEYLKGNRDYLEKELKARFPKIKITHTEGTYLQWASFSEYGEFDAEFFRKKAKVVLSDGKDFGAPGYVRINFGCPRGIIKEALDRMEQSFKGSFFQGKE